MQQRTEEVRLRREGEEEREAQARVDLKTILIIAGIILKGRMGGRQAKFATSWPVAAKCMFTFPRVEASC